MERLTKSEMDIDTLDGKIVELEEKIRNWRVG